MDTNSQTNLEIIEAQIRECFGRVVWSHKTQEKCADIILTRHKRIKFSQIALSALTTTGIITSIFGGNQAGLILSVVFSTILLALNSYTKDYDLGEISQKHSTAANDLWSIRESYLSLLTDLKSGILNYNSVVSRRDELQNRLSIAYRGSPRTINKAYKEATDGLKRKLENTCTDEEIDSFLPPELKKHI